MLSTTTLGVTAVTVVCGILYAWRKCRVYKFFDKLGLRGPKPLPFLGNYWEISKVGFTECLNLWRQQYGKVYGGFMGMRPTLFVGDVDMAREILVKQFATFPNRTPMVKQKPWTETLVYMTGDHWKQLRSIITPCFTSGKLKKTVPCIQRVVGKLLDNVKHKSETGEEVELKKLAGCYEMDLMAAAVFGLEIDSLNNPETSFVVHAHKVMNPKLWVVIVTFFFPFLTWVLKLFGVQMVDRKSTEWLLNAIDQTIDLRKSDPQYRRSDVLQLMLEVESGEEGEVDAEIFYKDHLQTSSSWTQRGITREEMKANCLGFLLGGYDTSATTLSFTLFCLAAQPDCLRKAQQEIDMKIGNGPIDYESVNSLQYLEMCLTETLRLYTPGFLLDRQCSEDIEVCGVKVPAGTSLFITTYSIHTDPDIWPDPFRFNPERHSSEEKAKRHSYSYMPFGMGPRNCVGMRLSQLELKMVVASILQRYSLVLCDKSVYPPKIIKFGKFGAVDGLWVKFKARS